MYCRKCGKQLLDDDNFCPNCGTAAVREPSPAVADSGNEVVFDPDRVPGQGESIDFEWDVEDFHRESKSEDIEIEWGDLLSEKKKDNSENVIEQVEQAAEPVTEESVPLEKSIFADEKKEPEMTDTFTAKSREFQELLDKERARLQAARQQREKKLQELGIESANKPVETSSEEEENKPSAAERVRMRREERAKRDETKIMEPVLPLKLDEDEMGGSWQPEETAAPAEEIQEESQPETIEEMVEQDSAAESESDSKGRTQQISREEFAAFLKKAEEEFGFEDIDESIQQDEMQVSDFDALEDIPEAEEPEQTEVPEVSEEIIEPEPEPAETPKEAKRREKEEKKAAKKAKKEADLEFGNFEDESFWDEEEDIEEKKGGRALTVAIVILAVILVVQISVLIIRFQFPDSQLAGIIEPVMTRIEEWIRGIFG